MNISQFFEIEVMGNGYAVIICVKLCRTRIHFEVPK